jgi:hypothetical protein
LRLYMRTSTHSIVALVGIRSTVSICGYNASLSERLADLNDL